MLCERLQNVMLNDRHQLWKMWNHFDVEHRGYLYPAEFRGLLSDMGLKLSRQHAEELMHKFSEVG